MMATTHALVGFVLGGAAVAAGVPAPVAVVAAVLGSVFPDFDQYWNHRRALHFPVLYPSAALLVGGLALAGGFASATGGPLVLVGTAVFLSGAALHTGLDVLGGGLELRPWEATSDRAVYDHVRGRWIPPRRWVRYDGSPEDLLVAGVLAGLAYPHYGGRARAAMAGLLAVSVVYVLLRRRLAALAPRVAATLPVRLRRFVPGRYVEDG